MQLPISNRAPGNARKHSKNQIWKIAESLKAFNFVNPVLVDRNGNIVAGHGRVEAAKSLGLGTVPTLQIEHLTQDQLRAYALTDNRLAELAGWDEKLLKIEFQYLLEIDLGFN